MKSIVRCLAVLAIMMLVACSGSGSHGSAGPSQGPSDAEILAIGKQLAQCMREHGLPDLPDPLVENGHLKLPEGVEAQFESRYPQQVLEQAQQACQHLMDQLPDSAIRSDDGGGDDKPKDAPGPADVDALRKFAQCMRENGFPGWPDPRADGAFPVAGTDIETEGKSPRFLDATKVCKQYWSGSLIFSRNST
jgi:hypothetical protein